MRTALRPAPAVARFLDGERDEINARWMKRVRETFPGESTLTDQQLLDSIHLFLDEVIAALRTPDDAAIAEGKSAVAREHGSQRHQVERNLAELVGEYFLLFAVVVELAEERGLPFTPAECVDLNTCIGVGVREAASEFGANAATALRRQSFEHFAFVAHELRNPLGSALIAWNLMGVHMADRDEMKGAKILGRSLRRLADLIDHALLEAKLRHADDGAGGLATVERTPIDAVIEDAVSECAVDASGRGMTIEVVSDANLFVLGDRRLLHSAITNLLRNGIKYSRPGARIELRAKLQELRVVLEVEDECGGLAPEAIERVFSAFVQAGDDRSGFGLGLAITKQAIEAQGGSVSVRSLPHRGCVFVVDLPLAPDPLRPEATA